MLNSYVWMLQLRNATDTAAQCSDHVVGCCLSCERPLSNASDTAAQCSDHVVGCCLSCERPLSNASDTAAQRETYEHLFQAKMYVHLMVGCDTSIFMRRLLCNQLYLCLIMLVVYFAIKIISQN